MASRFPLKPFFLDKRPCSSIWFKKKRFGLGLPCTLLEGGPTSLLTSQDPSGTQLVWQRSPKLLNLPWLKDPEPTEACGQEPRLLPP